MRGFWFIISSLLVISSPQTGLAAGETAIVRAAIRVGEIITGNEAIRSILRETPEGKELARLLLGRSFGTERDAQALVSRLSDPGLQGLAFELESRFARIEARIGAGRELAARIAAEELRLENFPPETVRLLRASPSYAASRDAFLAASAAAAAPVAPTRAAPVAPLERLTVAAVQFPIEGGRQVPEFLRRVEAYVSEAKGQGADLVVFPELLIYDLVSTAPGASQAAQLERIAREVTPELFALVRRISAERGIAILAGSAPRVSGGRIFNTALLAFPDGKLVLQDKLFLTPEEAAWNWSPGSELKVFNAPWGRSVILICYDSEIPSISHQLAGLNPEMILVPSMTGPDGLARVQVSAQTRAVEHHAYVVLTGAVKPSSPEYFAGQALMATPRARGYRGILAEGPRDQDAIVYGTFDLRQLRASRSGSWTIYPARDQSRRGSAIQVVEE